MVCDNTTAGVPDLSGTVMLRRLNKIISDNYSLILVSILVFIVPVVMIVYFGRQMADSIKLYKKAVVSGTGNTKKQPEDTELYEDDVYFDNTKYFEANKSDFLKEMQATYKNYNKEKDEYIKKTYAAKNDDVIDQSVLYKKYDNYDGLQAGPRV
jgi:hypothetical protein